MPERLQVVLARHGLASRRGVVSLIESGKVTVNGAVVLEKGHRVDAAKDEIRVDGERLPTEKALKKVYFLFHKPKGVMTTLQDPNAERTVADFFGDVSERVFPVGRLDRDTTGLLLVTNDGELSFRLTHPKFGVEKKYQVRVRGEMQEAKVRILEKGVDLEEGKTAPCRIRIEARKNGYTDLAVVLKEGKKRQIRRIFDSVGHFVTDLERVSYGPLSLGRLPVGQRRELTSAEVRALYQAAGLGQEGKKDPRRGR